LKDLEKEDKIHLVASMIWITSVIKIRYYSKMSKNGVVLVSAVLYVLISLVIIGVVLASVQPKINASKDRAAIEQSITLLNDIDEAVQTSDEVAGTRLNREVRIERGILTIDSLNDVMIWKLEDSSYKYSEPNVNINVGDIKVLTTQSGNKFEVSLILDYRGKLNITSEGRETQKIFQPAKIPYKIFIENKGRSGALNNIDFYSV